MRNEYHGVDHSLRLDEFDPFGQPLPPNRPYHLYVFVACAVLVSLLVVVLLAMKLPAILGDGRFDVTVAAQRSTESLQGQCRHAFSQYEASGKQWANLSPEEQRDRDDILAMFARLSKHMAANEEAKVLEMVDFDRLYKRIELTGNLGNWSRLERHFLRNQLKEGADIETFWGKILVVGFAETPKDPDSRIVYTLCWDEAGDQSECRFWIGRSGNSWKLYDWERLDLGLTESNDWGIYCKYAETNTLDGYNRWSELMGEIDSLTVEGEFDAAQAKLRVAERQPFPPELHDYGWLLTAYRWSALGEPEEALRCCRNVRRKSGTPGVYHSMANQAYSDRPAEALKHAKMYESSVGRNPDILETKAELLERLNRDEEAIVAWKNLLRMKPDDQRALVSCLLALPADNKVAFEEQLSQLENPAKVASDIVSSASYSDYPALLFLVDYLQRTSPELPATKHAAGLAQQYTGDYAKAAALFREAFEAEEETESRDSYADTYVEAMVAQGKVVAAIQAVPDKESALENLFYQYEDSEIELTKEEYAELVALFRQEFPDSLAALDRQVDLAISEKQFEEAERLLRPVLEKMPPNVPNKNPDETNEAGETDEFDEEAYYRQSLESSLATALYKQGKMTGAYQSAGDRGRRFLQLTRLAIHAEQWDDVESLLETHRAENPEDAAIHYIHGELAAHEKQWDAAIDHFQKGFKADTEEYNWYWKRRFLGVCVEARCGVDYYTTHEDPEEAFQELAREFIGDENWASLKALSAKHRQSHPEDIHLLTYAAQAAWERAEYDDYSRLARKLLKTDDDKLSIYQRSRVKHRLISAILRDHSPQMGSMLIRREFSRDEFSRDADKVIDKEIQALVHAAQGKMSEAQRLALESTGKEGSASVFYQHEDLGHVFLSGRFQKLQMDHPVGLPYGAAPLLAVFLLDEPMMLEKSDVTDALEKLGFRPVATPLTTIANRITGSFAVRYKKASFWITTGPGPYDETWRLEDDESPLNEVVKHHQAWLAVGTGGWSPFQREKVTKLARRVAAELGADKAVALCARRTNRWESYGVFPAKPELIESWVTTGDFESIEEEVVDLEDTDRSESITENRIFGRALCKVALEFESSPENRLRVWGSPTERQDMEPIELEIKNVERRYGTLSLNGTLMNKPTLLPGLWSGLSMQLEESEIFAFQLNDEAVVFRR